MDSISISEDSSASRQTRPQMKLLPLNHKINILKHSQLQFKINQIDQHDNIPDNTFPCNYHSSHVPVGTKTITYFTTDKQTNTRIQ